MALLEAFFLSFMQECDATEAQHVAAFSPWIDDESRVFIYTDYRGS
jgi:hypothetical protein